MVRAHVFVSGLVQGVFFRALTADEAFKHGVAGWVRNTEDGRVEAVFEGEREAVEAMIEWCRAGTPLARVDRVDVSWGEPEGIERFIVTR